MVVRCLLVLKILELQQVMMLDSQSYKMQPKISTKTLKISYRWQKGHKEIMKMFQKSMIARKNMGVVFHISKTIYRHLQVIILKCYGLLITHIIAVVLGS